MLYFLRVSVEKYRPRVDQDVELVSPLSIARPQPNCENRIEKKSLDVLSEISDLFTAQAVSSPATQFAVILINDLPDFDSGRDVVFGCN